MGKSVFSIISSLAGIAALIFLIYFCCLRKKRNNGRTFQTMIIGTTARSPAAAQPQYPTGTPYPNQASQVWPSFGQQPTPQQYPYPPANYTSPPYPTTHTAQHVTSGMPMPPASGAQNFYAPSAPSAPMAENDLPPPYSSVVRGS